MESSSKRRLTADELPHRIENFPLAQKLESRQNISNILTVLGIAIAVIGGLILIGGPSSIRVGWNGPTLWEMILLNPGPIFSIGVMLLVAGSQITPSVIQEVQTYVDEHFVLVNEPGVPAEEGVMTWQIVPGGHLDLVFVSLAELSEAEQQS
ncbi:MULTISPECIES: hypothetical protein [Marinobacter]|uniref:Uncharacterized protein n=2 Tax=Marinobacter TaxID=2742 RepID=A0A455W9L8_MARNT|nr:MULTISPECIES: hypothetical protein [unclassified Marinobacter]QFS88807.1 hypothetical protein FIV08_18360 [Marinobacter sp. THAF197a]QFT52592.1 hypothetical protein FIU96_18265 [Marinobacter sp. THAF39]BBJ05901.1 hypothetical protein YBY_37500 [Marinobacter nauticus]